MFIFLFVLGPSITHASSDTVRVIQLFDEIFEKRTNTFGKADSVFTLALQEAKVLGRIDYQIKITHLWSKLKLEHNEVDKGVMLAREAVELGLDDKTYKNSAYMRDAITQLSIALFYQGSYDSSRVWIKRGRQLSRSKDAFNESILLVMDWATGNYKIDVALAKLDSAIQLANQTESKHDDVMAILNKAEAVRTHSGWVASMETILSAQPLVNDKSLFDLKPDLWGRILFNYRQPKITLIRMFQLTYLALFDIENTIRYQNEMIQEYYNQGNFGFAPFPLIELAQLKTLQNKMEHEVLMLTDSAIKLHKKYTTRTSMHYPAYYYVQGWINENKKNYDQAIRYYKEGLQAELTDPYNFGLNLPAYFRANSVAHRVSVVDSLITHFATVRVQDNPAPFVRLAFEKAAHYKRRGQTARYMEHQLKALELKDSLSRIGRYYAIKEIETRFGVKEHELKLEQVSQIQKLQQAEIEKREMLIAGLLFGILLFIVLAVIIYRQYKSKQKQTIELAAKNNKVETLIRELHHRVKNNMQTISSILSLQSYGVQDEKAKAALQESKSRVEAMSIIHQKLYLDDDIRDINVEEYLHTMINTLAQSYGYNASAVTKTVDPSLKNLDVDLAIPLGLIINELVINAFKHAFVTVPDPNLHVSLIQRQDQIQLVVKDNGSGVDETKLTGTVSFGMKLIRTLAKQLNATFSQRNENGAVFELMIRYPAT